MKIQREHGFTIAEVIIAMFILSMVALVLNISLVSVISANKNSKDVAAATAAGNQVMEYLRMQPWANITGNGDTYQNRFARSWVVDTTYSDRKAITVYVSWPVATGAHRIQLSTLIAK
jgi:prepilin-type N-terminal cleavage/methylation domain-containing protein